MIRKNLQFSDLQAAATKFHNAEKAFTGATTFEICPRSELCITTKWKQVRFPKTKKRRIRKKWAKRSKNFGFVSEERILRDGYKLYVPQRFYNEFLEFHNKAGDGELNNKQNEIINNN